MLGSALRDSVVPKMSSQLPLTSVAGYDLSNFAPNISRQYAMAYRHCPLIFDSTFRGGWVEGACPRTRCREGGTKRFSETRSQKMAELRILNMQNGIESVVLKSKRLDGFEVCACHRTSLALEREYLPTAFPACKLQLQPHSYRHESS